jgi:hypothetical protein
LRAFQEGKSCLLSPGAPNSPVRISFLLWCSRPLAPGSRWRTGHCPVHTGQSGAPSRPLARSTCLVQIAQPTVGPADRWLTGQFGAHRTVRCSQTEQSLGCSSQDISNCSFPVSSTYTQYISLKNNVLSLRNIPFDMICTLSTPLHRLTQKHLCWHLITKILRNGQRAHFPFNGSGSSSDI